MLGLIVIAVGLIYLLISILIVTLAWRAAKRRGTAGWKWGLPAALVMYLLVFWDHIPTLLAHKYYCHKQSGFTVYKTLEQWEKENPGAEQGLTPLAKSLKLGKAVFWQVLRCTCWCFGIIFRRLLRTSITATDMQGSRFTKR